MDSDFTPGYYLVEIMGHRTHIGFCREVGRFGTSMLRIETIGLEEIPAEERTATREEESWNSRTREYEVSVQTGRWVRPGTPAVPVEVFEYSGNAIFSMREITGDEAREMTREKHPRRREHFVADETTPLMIEAPKESEVGEATEGDGRSEDELMEMGAIPYDGRFEEGA